MIATVWSIAAALVPAPTRNPPRCAARAIATPPASATANPPVGAMRDARKEAVATWARPTDTHSSWQPARSPLPEPPSGLDFPEDDEVAPVHGDDLPVATADRAVGPPTVLDEPGLAHRVHRAAVDDERAAALPRPHASGQRFVQPSRAGAHSNGASTARRSGTRESGSTSSTRSAASGPAAARACRTASRRRPRRSVAPS